MESGGGADSHSFLLDPSFLNSLLPLEKKPLFFLPCAEQSVCGGLSAAGRGAGGELQASAAAGPGAGSGFDVGLAGLGCGSVCSVGSGEGGSVSGGKTSSRVEGPGSCGSAEDVQVPFEKKVESMRTLNMNADSNI